MRKAILIVGALGATAVAAALSACGSSSGDPTPPSVAGPSIDGGDGGVVVNDAGTTPDGQIFSVGGSVSGLLGSGLVLQNNGGDDIPVAKDGSFTFPSKLKPGAAFAVTVKTQPTGPTQTCIVTGGTGTLVGGNVTSVTVNCATNKYVVSGTVSGLAGSGLVLQNNAGDDVIVSANGTFAFPTTLNSGAKYAVTVKTQPSAPTQTCTVANGTGTLATANVTNVAVTCVTNEYKVGGSVSGLVGKGLTLEVDGGQSIPISADGPFQFPVPIASGATYTVTVSAQPDSPQQTCTVSGDTGTVGSADVSSVLVNCATNAYAIGGKVTGLAGTGLVLQNNGANDLKISGDGTFAFSQPIENGQPYAVTIASQPTTPWQTCTLANASGTVGTSAVSDIAVTCTTNAYKVKVAVSGLAGTGLVLQNNAGDDLPISADGNFEFPASVASGTTFNVTVKDHPTGLSQTCSVTNGTGTIGGADVENVAIACVTNSYTVGGMLSGLTSGSIVLTNNGGDDLTLDANGAFSFKTSIASGNTYSVAIKTKPAGLFCGVTSESGTVTNANVTNVSVTCASTAYATAKMNGKGGYSQTSTSTKDLVFLLLPAGTQINNSADYKAACESKGFAQNQNKDPSIPATPPMYSAVDYYCEANCCFLGSGNKMAQALTSFQNHGVPLNTSYKVYDRGCGDWLGLLSTSINTTDTLTVSSNTTFTYAENGSDYGQNKTLTFQSDSLIVCEQP